MANFRTDPYQQERYRSRGKVKLYYVGVDYHNAHKGNPPPVYVKTQAIGMPDLGEHLVLDEILANDIIQRTIYNGKPIFMLEAEGGEGFAEMLRSDAFTGEADFEKARARHIAAQHLSEEDLQYLLEQKTGKAKPKAESKLSAKSKGDN